MKLPIAIALTFLFSGPAFSKDLSQNTFPSGQLKLPEVDTYGIAEQSPVLTGMRL